MLIVVYFEEDICVARFWYELSIVLLEADISVTFL